MSSKIRDIVKSINSLEARILVDKSDDWTFKVSDFGYRTAELSAEYSYFNYVTLEFNLVQAGYKMIFFVSFKKTSDNNGENNKRFTLTVSSNSLSVKEKQFLDDDGTWRLITKYYNNNYSLQSFDISVHISMNVKQNLFNNMYEDSEFTDFAIKGKDGSVTFHRSVLAAISPVLKTMLQGSWKEAKEGTVDFADTSKALLQHFKDYIYKQELPKNDKSLQQLLLLAKCYMVDCLEQACLLKLICNANTGNVYDLVEFSILNDMPELMMGIFNKFHKRDINIVGVQQHFIKKRQKTK